MPLLAISSPAMLNMLPKVALLYFINLEQSLALVIVQPDG